MNKNLLILINAVQANKLGNVWLCVQMSGASHTHTPKKQHLTLQVGGGGGNNPSEQQAGTHSLITSHEGLYRSDLLFYVAV